MQSTARMLPVLLGLGGGFLVANIAWLDHSTAANHSPAPGDTQPPDTTGEAPDEAFILLAVTGDGQTIGGPCKPSDGWLPDAEEQMPPEIKEAEDEAMPVLLHADETYEASAPLGVLHCLTGSVFPYGYLSAHCATDKDCPGESVCDCAPGRACDEEDPGQCRMPCESSSECLAPTTCKPEGTGDVRYCKCGGKCETRFADDAQ